jgi:hypothetical protein
MRHLFIVLTVAVFAGAVLTGCSMFKVKGKTHMKVTKNGETIAEKTVEFDSLEELPGAMKETYGALADTTSVLIKELTEAPPPGSVKLSALNPSLAKFEGRQGFDFLVQASQEAGVDKFQYVQIGVPSYDMFFKDCAEFYALTFQTTQAVGRMKKLAAAVLEADASAEVTDLAGFVGQALGVTPAPQNRLHQGNLRMAAEMASVLSTSVQALVAKTQQLIASGQQLVAGAPASITNPKTVLHLDLIVQGLQESVAMVVETGKLVPELIAQLTGF